MARAPRATVTINTGNGWFAFKRIINKKSSSIISRYTHTSIRCGAKGKYIKFA